MVTGSIAGCLLIVIATAAVTIQIVSCDSSSGKMASINYPFGCTSNYDCEHRITWQISPEDANNVRFELFTKRNSEDGDSDGDEGVDYIAFGISKHHKKFMKSASVIVCGASVGIDSAKAVTYLSYNSHKNSHVLPRPYQKMVKLVKSVLNDSVIYCQIDRVLRPDDELREQIFALDDGLYYPAWAVGPNGADNQLSFHGKHKKGYRIKVNFADPSSFDVAHFNQLSWLDKELLTKFHAIFMMIGWMICIGTSLFCPRYLRLVWTQHVFGTDLWFLVHRSLMVKD